MSIWGKTQGDGIVALGVGFLLSSSGPDGTTKYGIGVHTYGTNPDNPDIGN